MRFLLLSVLLFIALVPASGRAGERVMEVQGVRVELTGAGGREAAFARATEQAASQVLQKLGYKQTLPKLSPAQLESLSTYVDVANESAQPNYYAGTFNVGVRVNPLLQMAGVKGGPDTGGQAAPDAVSTETEEGTLPVGVSAQTRGTSVPAVSSSFWRGGAAGSADQTHVTEAPRWVLVVPLRQAGSVLTLWDTQDPWAVAWQKMPGGEGVTVASAGGDEGDKSIFPVSLLENSLPSLLGPLNALARKYSAPAVALVVLRADNNPIRPDDEVQLDVTYLVRNGEETQIAESSLFVNGAMNRDPWAAAMQEGRRLITALATGQPLTEGRRVAPPGGSGYGAGVPGAAAGYNNASGVAPYGTPGRSSSAQTVYPEHVLRPPASVLSPVPVPAPASVPSAAAVGSGSETSLWVRIPLSQPSDLAGYRRKIESIPGARFDISALNRSYVEGNIRYEGSRAALMQELAARGLAQTP